MLNGYSRGRKGIDVGLNRSTLFRTNILGGLFFNVDLVVCGLYRDLYYTSYCFRGKTARPIVTAGASKELLMIWS